MERSSAEHAPSCSEPETMATAQRHHLYVSSGRICIVGSLLVQTHFYLHAPVRTHDSITPTHRHSGVNFRNFKHGGGFRLNSNNAN